MLLMIDNYDSFTFNLVQYFGELGEDVRVFRNDEITSTASPRCSPTRWCSRPGPCSPAEAGVCVDGDPAFTGKLPILGVCLGHQAIGAALGGKVVRAQTLMHGKAERASATDGRGVYAGLPEQLHGDPLPLAGDRARDAAARRSRSPRPRATARSWACATASWRHQAPLEGVQFHPESILTEHGHAMLQNFLEAARDESASSTCAATPSRGRPPAMRAAMAARRGRRRRVRRRPDASTRCRSASPRCSARRRRCSCPAARRATWSRS